MGRGRTRAASPRANCPRRSSVVGAGDVRLQQQENAGVGFAPFSLLFRWERAVLLHFTSFPWKPRFFFFSWWGGKKDWTRPIGRVLPGWEPLLLPPALLASLPPSPLRCLHVRTPYFPLQFFCPLPLVGAMPSFPSLNLSLWVSAPPPPHLSLATANYVTRSLLSVASFSVKFSSCCLDWNTILNTKVWRFDDCCGANEGEGESTSSHHSLVRIPVPLSKDKDKIKIN